MFVLILLRAIIERNLSKEKPRLGRGWGWSCEGLYSGAGFQVWFKPVKALVVISGDNGR